MRICSLIFFFIAHAVVPFYGQGCNAGIEGITVYTLIFTLLGCRVLSELLSKYLKDKDSIHDHSLVLQTLEEYSRIRKPSADAVCDLALQNMVEMASKTASKTFLLQKKIGLLLHRVMPESFKPLYTMVTFSPQISYKEAWDTHCAREKRLTKVAKTLQWAAIGAAIAVVYKYVYPKAKEALQKFK